MTDLRSAGSTGSFSCLCSACETFAMSRRQFLCTGTAGAITAASSAGVIAASSGAAHAQQPAVAPGRPILRMRAMKYFTPSQASTPPYLGASAPPPGGAASAVQAL